MLLTPKQIESFTETAPITITCGHEITMQREVQSIPTLTFICSQIFVLSIPTVTLLLILAFQFGSVRTQFKYRKQMPRSTLAF